jgi:hypothetical protein
LKDRLLLACFIALWLAAAIAAGYVAWRLAG